jgi:hypothetical protein
MGRAGPEAKLGRATVGGEAADETKNEGHGQTSGAGLRSKQEKEKEGFFLF